MGPPAVAVHDLVVRFGPAPEGVVALDGISLEARVGEVVALVGPSGCGKSTLLRVVAGLVPATSGTVTVLAGTPGRPGAAVLMPQRDALMPWRRAIDNVVLGVEVGGGDVAAARRDAGELFTRFGLAGFERAWPRQLSGGMRQRVAFLRTLLTPAPLLLLDEPFGALDPLTRQDLVGWVQEVWAGGEEPPRNVLLVTHDVEEALRLADRVVVLSARPGRVVGQVDAPFVRPRAAELVTSGAFVAARAQVMRLLAEPAPPT